MIHVGVVQVKNLKNVMDPSSIVHAIQEVVLTPSLASTLWLGGVSFISELIAPLPSSLLLGGQLFFIKDLLSLEMIARLIFFVALPMAVGTTLGSFLTYGLAFGGGKLAIEKFKKYLRFSWQDVERLESKFANKWYDELLFLVARCVPLLPTIPINVVAGVLRMKPLKYTLLTLLGTTVRLSIMVIIFGVGIINT